MQTSLSATKIVGLQSHLLRMVLVVTLQLLDLSFLLLDTISLHPVALDFAALVLLKTEQ